jgi:hypothetical protein
MTKLNFAMPALLGLSLALGATGCAKDRHEAVPSSAMEVSEAQGDIKYTAPEDGEVYVQNTNGDELIYSGRIRKGETLSVEPEDDEDKIRIDSQIVSTKDLKEGDKHKIFFKAESDRDRDRSVGLAGDREGRVVREERTTTVRDAEPRDTERKVVTETETRTGTSGDKVIVEEKKTTERKP